MVVGLIPAAGHATRLGRQPSSKEVIEVRGRPVMDHLVERMRAADPDELRVVTRPEKTDVVRHAEALGARVVLGHPSDVSASLQLGIEGLSPDDEVLIGFPDSLWEPPDGFSRLLAELRAGAEVALGLFESDELERADVVVCDPDGRVTRIAVKPEQPPSDVLWGIAATRVRSLRGLTEGTEPGAHFGAMAPQKTVIGIRLSSEWIDIGTPDTLERVRNS